MKPAQKSIPAVTLKSIADIPVEFSMPVPIPLRVGGTATITLQCRALAKTEWAAIRDRYNADLQARAESRVNPEPPAPGAPVPAFSMASAVHDGLENNAALVLEFATGWDLADPLDAQSVQRLEDKSGGALQAFVAHYETAIYQSRLGN